jgi:TRAP-type C4-dicarboxylate transport system substrate-binding protein
MERTAEQSGGELSWKPFFGGTVGGPTEMLSSVESNIVDVSGVIDIYHKAQLPLASMISGLITKGQNPLALAAAMNEFHSLRCPECVEERSKNNIVGLGWSATGVYSLMCKEPINSLDTLKGKKIRATASLGRVIQAMGGVSVSTTTVEAYEAMQRGQLDCVAGPASWLTALNLIDMSKSVTDFSFGSYFGNILFAVNKDVWEGLDPKIKRLLLDNVAQSVTDVVYAYVDETKEAIDLLKSKGGTVEAVDDAFRQSFVESEKNEIVKAIEDGKKAGYDNAEEIMNTFLELAAKWDKILKEEVKDDRAAYTAALNREIYSKISN